MDPSASTASACPPTAELPRPPARLLAAHAWARRQPWLLRFTWMNRVLLALAFLPTGLVKAMGQRFTQLPVENPVGFFFEAMYRTGPYWHFIGGVQVVAAVLLLVPRTAALGAVLFAPIGVSILLITWGIGFGGTVYVAAGMALSVTYLICWDADRIWNAVAQLLIPSTVAPVRAAMHRVEAVGWGLGVLAGLGLVMTTRGFVPVEARLGLLGAGALAALLVPVGWILAGLRARRG